MRWLITVMLILVGGGLSWASFATLNDRNLNAIAMGFGAGVALFFAFCFIVWG